MKKIIIAIVAIVAIGSLWFLFTADNTAEYTKTVTDEITALENELAEIDAAVEAGTLTPEQATEAKVKIITRLATIDAAVTEANKSRLTQEQKNTLAAGLRNLVDAMEKYKNTLAAVDEAAIDSEVEAQLAAKVNEDRNLGVSLSAGASLTAVIEDVVDSVEEAADVDSEDYMTDDTEMNDEMPDDSATTSDEETTSDDDTTTDTEETTVDDESPSMEMPAQDDSDTDEMIVIEASTTVEAETEITQ